MPAPNSHSSQTVELHSLLRAAMAGDATAAEEFWRSYEPELLVMVRVRMRDPLIRRFADTLDLCQTIKRRFFQHADRYKPQSVAEFHRLMETLLIRRMHALSKKAANEAERDVMAATRIADAAADRQYVIEMFHDLKPRFSDEEWALFERCRIDGQTYVSVAAEEGVSEDAIRKRIDRVVEKIRKQLADESQESTE